MFSVALVSCCFCFFLQPFMCFSRGSGVFGDEELFRFLGRSIKFFRLHWVVQVRDGDRSGLL